MRFGAVLLQLLAAVVTAGAGAWWVATGVMRLVARWLERRWPLRGGPLGACAAVLGSCAAVVGGVAVLVAWGLFGWLWAAPAAVGVVGWIAGLWRVLVTVATLLLAGAGVGAAVREAFVAFGSARRRWFLVSNNGMGAAVEAAAAPAAEGGPGRAIVIFCDGTSNRPDEMESGVAAPTNVWKLFDAAVSDVAQVTWYQAGVGSDTSSTAGAVRWTGSLLKAVGANPGAQVAAFGSRVVKLFESAFGSGISEGMINGYTEIVRQYRPGDRIYLVGFSRGAFTARCIAGVIARCGLLRAENVRYATEMVQLYRNRVSPNADLAVRADMIHAERAVEFVGVFDTVASLGVPLWGWWFRASPIWKLEPLTNDPVTACRFVYHALAMDERRSQFFPALFGDALRREGVHGRLEHLEQVWFRGAHADVGGGYGQHALSDIPLGWMMDAMVRHGVRLKANARAGLAPNAPSESTVQTYGDSASSHRALAPLHDELQRRPDWVLFGAWPRWHPVPGGVPDGQGTVLHPSVLERAAATAEKTGRPDLVRLAEGESRAFVAEAQRTWDRTGMVIEAGATYRLTYEGERWRDAEAPRCGPAGQLARGMLDQRRWFEAGRRLRREPWMRLVATVAHPRVWPLQERGLRELVTVLFSHDPAALTRQLAPIGRDLAEAGASVLIRNEAEGGLLHLFANDWYQTANNNSGGVRLRLTRVADGAAGPVWVLGADGGWDRRG